MTRTFSPILAVRSGPESVSPVWRAWLAAVVVELLVIGGMAFALRTEKVQPPVAPPMQWILIPPQPAKVASLPPRPVAQPNKPTPKPMPRHIPSPKRAVERAAPPLSRPIQQPMERPLTAAPAPSPMAATPVPPSPVSPPPAQKIDAVKSDLLPREDQAGEGQYAGKLVREIEKHKVYPPSAKELDMTGDVTFTYTIDRQGRVVKASIVHSSGFRLLDEAALQALRASHFGPMTAGLWPGSANKTFTTTVHFQLDD